MRNPFISIEKHWEILHWKYNILDKQAYALVQDLKEFRVYIIHSHIICHVPTSVVKDIITQPNPEGIRWKWIAILLEYDLEIKPTKLIKGHRPARIMAQYKCDALSLHTIVELSVEGKNPKEKPEP